MTPESLSREGSPTPGHEIILAAPGASPDQATTISIPDIKTQHLDQPQGQHIQLGSGPQTLKLTSGGLQLASLGPGQPLQLTAAGQIVTSNGAPLQPAQILTNGTGGYSVYPPSQAKLIVANNAPGPGHNAPRLIVPAHQLTSMLGPAQDKAPGGLGGPQGPRVVSLGGLSLTSPVSGQPPPSVSTIISRTKQVVTSSSPVLLQPANRCVECTQSIISHMITFYSGADIKRVYSSLPPANTPITPGTQIILSEGVANGGVAARNCVSINPIVSLPLHPVPQSQTENLSITR